MLLKAHNYKLSTPSSLEETERLKKEKTENIQLKTKFCEQIKIDKDASLVRANISRHILTPI